MGNTEKIKPFIEQLREVLVRNVGDTRSCPNCGKAFIPHDSTTEQTWVLFEILFKSNDVEEIYGTSVLDDPEYQAAQKWLNRLFSKALKRI